MHDAIAAGGVESPTMGETAVAIVAEGAPTADVRAQMREDVASGGVVAGSSDDIALVLSERGADWKLQASLRGAVFSREYPRRERRQSEIQWHLAPPERSRGRQSSHRHRQAHHEEGILSPPDDNVDYQRATRIWWRMSDEEPLTAEPPTNLSEPPIGYDVLVYEGDKDSNGSVSIFAIYACAALN